MSLNMQIDVHSRTGPLNNPNSVQPFSSFIYQSQLSDFEGLDLICLYSLSSSLSIWWLVLPIELAYPSKILIIEALLTIKLSTDQYKLTSLCSVPICWPQFLYKTIKLLDILLLVFPICVWLSCSTSPFHYFSSIPFCTILQVLGMRI